MAQSLLFPNKYHIVWLDPYIGEPDCCLQLKRAFFTHIDPKSGQEICFSDTDIDRMIQCQSEIPVTFDSFHLTLKAFVEESACLKYIDEIQDHRILFIASSRLGQPAVEQLLKRYTHSFTNKQTNEPYDSIYIFCTDIAKAAEWADPYCEYVQIFDFETDLLARMTRDVGEEFFKHGQQLLEANQYGAAIERLSWSKSLFIRYDTLKFPNEPENQQSATDANTRTQQERVYYAQPSSKQQPKPSQKLQEIDRLLASAEEQMRQQYENDSDHRMVFTNVFPYDGFQTQTTSNEATSPIEEHLIICLNELSSSCEQMETEGEYTSDSTPVQTEDPTTRYLMQFEHETKACFSNIPGDLEIFHDMDDCRQCISENSSAKKIFLIMSGSTAEKMLARLSETYGSVKKIYVLDGYISEIVEWVNHYRDQGIDILLFDLYKNLLIRVLQDISKYYLSKGEDLKSSISSSTNSALVYFDWAKKMVIRANQLAQNEFKDQLNNIEKYKNETENLIQQTNFNYDVEQRIQSYQLEEDSDSVVMIFIVGSEMKLIHLTSGIARLITCTTNDQIVSAINNVKLLTPIIIVSTTSPSDNIMSLNQVLYYYCFSKAEESVKTPTTNYSNVIYVSSIDYLMDQLYHKLGQYYRDRAIRASIESKDQGKAKRLLERSTQCYKLLEADTEKTLKRYAEMLKKK